MHKTKFLIFIPILCQLFSSPFQKIRFGSLPMSSIPVSLHNCTSQKLKSLFDLFFYIRQTYPICHQVVNRYLISSTLPLPLVVNYHLSTHVTLAIFECFMPAFLPMPLHLKVKLLFYNSDKDWSNSKLALMFQKSVQLYLPKISIKDLSNMNLLWHI